MTRRGFSLIELIVVIVLLAIVAATASLSLRGYVQRHRLARAAETLGRFDLALRAEARRKRAIVTGMIEPRRGRLTVQATEPYRTFDLPASVRVGTVRVGQVMSSSRRRQIAVNPIGDSPSYAIEVVSGSTSRWVFFSGGCGQQVNDLDRDQIAALLGAS